MSSAVPDAFVVVASETGGFGAAVLRKLLVEVAGLPSPADAGAPDRRPPRRHRRRSPIASSAARTVAASSRRRYGLRITMSAAGSPFGSGRK